VDSKRDRNGHNGSREASACGLGRYCSWVLLRVAGPSERVCGEINGDILLFRTEQSHLVHGPSVQFHLSSLSSPTQGDQIALHCVHQARHISSANHLKLSSLSLHGAAWSIPECARRTSTSQVCAFREQEDGQAAPSRPSEAARCASRESKPSYFPIFHALMTGWRG
jgi:hypothetical protein